MALHETLNLRRDEVVPVSLLLFQSVFLGFFLGAFDVGANTLFLNSFEQSMIPKAFVISGIVGIVLTSLYSYFQSKLSFSSLAALNLVVVFGITFLLRLGYYFSDTKWLAFALFVLMGPLNIVALVGFWGTVGRIFDLRQGKRIFGFIDTGQVVGVIISSLSIPFLITIGLVTKDLLYISAVSIFLAVIIQLFINSKYSQQLKVKVVSANKSSFVETLRIPYVRTMAIFVVLSMLVAFFVHFLFLSVASQRFDEPDEMAKFFGGLMGTLTIVSVLIKAFVYGPLMKTYGLKVSLLVSPAVMLIVTVSAAIVGSAFGYTVESAAFTLFFLLISLSKFFQKALKDSIEAPALKLLYQSLSPSIRHEVQARVDGTINEMAALLSGVVLTLLGLIGFFVLIHYTYILLGLILMWAVVSVSLFIGYRKTLKDTLENASSKEKQLSLSDYWLRKIRPVSAVKKYGIIELSKPWLLLEELKYDLKRVDGADLEVVCSEINDLGFVELIPFIEKRIASESNDDSERMLSKTLDYLKSLLDEANNVVGIVSLIQSKSFEDRIRAAKLIGASSNHELKQRLTFLLRDLVPSVKKQAIWAARGSHSKDIISFLIDFLDKDFYAPIAHAALVGSGEIGLEMLMLTFNKSDSSAKLQERIIRIIPQTGSTIAAHVLFSKLSVTSHLKEAILEGLLQLNFLADDNDGVILHQMILEQAGVCAWNLNALHNCPSSSAVPGLKHELENNFFHSRSTLFQLLKLTYDRSSIDAVLENLEAGTGESISFAIELLDTFMVEDLKPYITPLLEDATLANRVWALQNYFPLRSYSAEDLLKAIINRNENLVTKYAKIYALNAYSNVEELSITADLAAQLFNSDRVLRLISAQIISSINQQSYLKLKKRLTDKHRVELDRMLEVVHAVEGSTIEQLAFFREVAKDQNYAAPLYWLYNTISIRVSNTNILELGVFKQNSYVLFIEKGEVTVKEKENLSHTYSIGDAVLVKNGDIDRIQLLAQDNTVVHFIDYKKLSAALYDYDFLSEYLANISVIA